MNRREFQKSCLAGLASLSLGKGSNIAAQERHTTSPRLASQDQPAFELRGVYFHDGFHVDPQRLAPLYWEESEWRRQITWLKSCGVNAVEFATMLEFNRIPSTSLEKNKIASRLRILDLAHELDLKFGYILTNTVVSTVPEGKEPGDQLKDRAETLCPRIPGNFDKTIALQSWFMETYKEADFFEEFAADWGGCFCGECNVQQYLRYVKELGKQLAERNAMAEMYANTWCVSYWGPNPILLGWKHVFELETVGSRDVIQSIGALPDNIHLALPCHNLYRQLVYSSFGGRQDTPEFPRKSDLQELVDRGKKVLAWPHFVMDDDTGRAPQWGLVHSEVRYIQAMLKRLQQAGIARVMGNLYLPTLQLSNAYSFGRLATVPSTEPQEILRDFARLIAHPEDMDSLCEVLYWLDNHSYWNEQLPADAREAELPCTLNKESALAALAKVRACQSPELPLPVSPQQWLEDLAASIPRMTWAT